MSDKTRLATAALERSTYVVQVDWYDEDGESVVPATATWTLTDEAGNVVNGRDGVSISVPAASNDIVLSGADLALVAGLSEEVRLLTVEATYDSDHGVGLPLKAVAQFVVKDLEAV